MGTAVYKGGGNYEPQLAENQGVGQRMIVKVLNYPPVYQLYPFYYNTLSKMFIHIYMWRKKIFINNSYCEIKIRLLLLYYKFNIYIFFFLFIFSSESFLMSKLFIQKYEVLYVPRSLCPFYIVTYHTERVKTSWWYSMNELLFVLLRIFHLVCWRKWFSGWLVIFHKSFSLNLCFTCSFTRVQWDDAIEMKN